MNIQDLEDDVCIGDGAPVVNEWVAPRKLSRLKKGAQANEDQGSVSLVNEEDDDDDDDDNIIEYRDEEDELEEYFVLKKEGKDVSLLGTGSVSAASEDSDLSESEEDEDWDITEKGPTTIDTPDDDLAAETQRVLRDVASRDRIGKASSSSHPKTSNHLSSVLQILEQKNERIRQNAKHRELSRRDRDLPSFDDIMGLSVVHETMAEKEKMDTDSDIDVVQEGEEDDLCDHRIVEIPSTIKKKESWDFPSTAEFEDEAPLIDDGYESPTTSEDTEDSRPLRSTEKEDSGDDAGLERPHEVLEDIEEDVESQEKEKEEEESQEKGEALEERNKKLNTMMEKMAQKVQNAFIEQEAELSEEELAGISDDEDEEALDESGAGLEEFIVDASQAKEKKKDKEAREVAHIEWQRAQDAKELAAVLKGVRNGFRRGRNSLSEDEDDAAGRRRRIRLVEDDEDAPPADFDLFNSENFSFLRGSKTQQGEEDESDAEDELMMQKARRHHRLAESEEAIAFEEELRGEPLLDADSQQILNLLKRTSSLEQDQPNGGRFWGRMLGLSYKENQTNNSHGGHDDTTHKDDEDGNNSQGPLTSPGFVGKSLLSTLARPSTAFGNRSFVFGRDFSQSNSGIQGLNNEGKNGRPVGPTTFSNLKQMTTDRDTVVPAKGGGNRLLSRLTSSGTTASSKHDSFCAASAVVELCAQRNTYRS